MDREPGERLDLYARIGRPANDRVNFIDRCGASEGSHMQSDRRGYCLEMIGKFVAQAMRNHGVPDPVDVPHFADVPGKPTIINKACQGHLKG